MDHDGFTAFDQYFGDHFADRDDARWPEDDLALGTGVGNEVNR
jgi:hypothetical protein